jgi:hypothetical protein
VAFACFVLFYKELFKYGVLVHLDPGLQLTGQNYLPILGNLPISKSRQEKGSNLHVHVHLYLHFNLNLSLSPSALGFASTASAIIKKERKGKERRLNPSRVLV